MSDMSDMSESESEFSGVGGSCMAFDKAKGVCTNAPMRKGTHTDVCTLQKRRVHLDGDERERWCHRREMPWDPPPPPPTHTHTT